MPILSTIPKRNGRIYSLSVELLVEILSHLQHRDLLRCRQVSRTFSVLVRETPVLQYTLELGLTGYEDCPSSSSAPPNSNMSIVHRLASLRAIQRAWRNPRPRLVRTLTVPSQDWLEARWFKDVLAGRIPSDVRTLDVLYLSGAGARTLTFDIDFDAACVDPGQDLVVLTRAASGPNAGGVRPPPRVYLRSLSTQGPHPRAQQSFIDLAGYGFLWAPFARRLKVQVTGVYLAITVYKQLVVDAILVWHWPSGAINAALRAPPDTSYLSAFCTSTGYLLVNTHRRAHPAWFGICVYALTPCDPDAPPCLLARFSLPALRWDPSSLLSSSFFPSYTRHGTPGGRPSAACVCACAPGCALVQLRMDLQYTLYTPMETFVSVCEDILKERERSKGRGGYGGEPRSVPWAAWGPKRTRIVEEGTEAPVVCGFRAVYSDCILDFCPWDVATNAYAPDNESGSDASEHGAEGDAGMQLRKHVSAGGEVHAASSTLRASMFAEPVVTGLAYRKTRLAFPHGAAGADVQVVLEDAEGPKIIRAACKDFVLVPTSIEVYAI